MSGQEIIFEWLLPTLTAGFYLVAGAVIYGWGRS